MVFTTFSETSGKITNNYSDKSTSTATATASSTSQGDSDLESLNHSSKISENIVTDILIQNNLDKKKIESCELLLNVKSKVISSPVPPIIPPENINTILIVCDELVSYDNLPEKIKNLLPGYQAFSKLGIEFTNIHNNRQDCSPSRSSFITSYLDTGISDNIDQTWQYNSIPNLPTYLDTMGKSFKKNDFTTAYYGKNHIQSSIATDYNFIPAFNTNSRGCMKEYGFDIFNTYGDSYYYNNAGYFSDNIALEIKVNDQLDEVDYIDSTGKYIGILPFLKQRQIDQKPYFLSCHFENPHDTQNFWNNLSQQPSTTILQYWMPYIDEQIKLINSTDTSANAYNPFVFSKLFPDAYIKNKNLSTNFFENTFNEYITDVTSLPFLESYLLDYVTNSKTNSIFPSFVGLQQSFVTSNTIATDEKDIKSWKNLVNNYYGLIIETDFYIYKIYKYLLENNLLSSTNVLITSDHGDVMSAHGIKQKGLPFNECVNVAFVIYSPFIDKSLIGKKTSVLGSLLDLAPTLDVLANLSNKNSKFQGKSLLEWRSNSQGKQRLFARSQNIPVFQIVNSWMNNFTYFGYLNWYDDQSDETKQKVTFQPDNFFSFLGFYLMIIDIIDGKQYKLVRYFNYNELLLFNYIHNDRLKNTLFTVDLIIENINSNIKKNPQYLDDIISLKKYLTSIFGNNNFSYVEINNLYASKPDSPDFCILISAIQEITNKLTGNFKLLIPGYYVLDSPYWPPVNNFNAYYTDPDKNYAFFLYNMTDDPNETINLIDTGYPDRTTQVNLDIASILNNNLNKLIDKYKIIEFTFIPITLVNLSTLYTIKTSGNDYKNYTKSQLIQSLTGYGLGTRDGMFPKSFLFEVLLLNSLEK